MTKLDSILKSRDITLPTKVCIVKAMVFLGFPGGSVKNPPTMQETWIPSLDWDSSREIPHGQRSLAGYSSWGCKKLDTTEHLSTSTCMDVKVGP